MACNTNDRRSVPVGVCPESNTMQRDGSIAACSISFADHTPKKQRRPTEMSLQPRGLRAGNFQNDISPPSERSLRDIAPLSASIENSSSLPMST